VSYNKISQRSLICPNDQMRWDNRYYYILKVYSRSWLVKTCQIILGISWSRRVISAADAINLAYTEPSLSGSGYEIADAISVQYSKGIPGEYRMVFRAGLRDPCTRDVARLSGKRKNTQAAGECPKVEQHPKCINHVILLGKPFGNCFIKWLQWNNDILRIPRKSRKGILIPHAG
jgi:hypothetical protein